MNKTEFLEYLKFLKKLFPSADIPKDKEIIGIWYEPFKKISYETAKKMATDYFKAETGNFNYARLLKCKPEPRSNAQAYQPAVSIFDIDK